MQIKIIRRFVLALLVFSLKIPTSLLAPRKWPRQARSRATVDAILEATALLLEEGKSCSTNAIAERTGVGIATLYQYFDGRDGVIAALSRQVRARLEQFPLNMVHIQRL